MLSLQFSEITKYKTNEIKFILYMFFPKSDIIKYKDTIT